MADSVTADVTSSTGPTLANSDGNGRLDSELETAPNSSCICRDFLRNVCRRGDRCRFLHPADPTSARRDVIAAAHHRPLVFCHDFQNAAGCKRGSSCRFAHCTRDEEATYRRTGLLPFHVQRKLALDVAISRALLRGETPVCLDFIKAGGCRRAAGKCRYRHVTAAEFEREQLSIGEHQMSLQCTSTESDSYVQSGSVAASAAAMVFRKRKLTSDDTNCDDVILCGSKLGCAANGYEPTSASTCAVGPLIAVLEPVNQLATNRWTTSLHDLRSQYCVGRPCRLVAVPAAPAVGFGSATLQPPLHFASSPSGVAILAPTPSQAALGMLTVLQPYV